MAARAYPLTWLNDILVPASSPQARGIAELDLPSLYLAILIGDVDVENGMRVPEIEPGNDALDFDVAALIEKRCLRVMGIGWRRQSDTEQRYC